MKQIPSWLEAHRAQWSYRGGGRPPFAHEPEPGQESVWDYPRPPRIEDDARLVRVMGGDLSIARTTRARRVLETASPPTIYVPPGDVCTELLRPGSSGSLCEWKGESVYWSLEFPEGLCSDVAWSYPDPLPGFEDIAGYISFYPAKIACYLGEERVRAQPGGFYGGWVTGEIVGPFKGEPGTNGW